MKSNFFDEWKIRRRMSRSSWGACTILVLLCLINSVLRSLIVSDPHTHHPHISFGWFPSTPPPFDDGSPPFTVNHHWPSPSSPCHLPAAAAAAVTGLMVSYHVGRIITVMWTDTHLQCAVYRSSQPPPLHRGRHDRFKNAAQRFVSCVYIILLLLSIPLHVSLSFSTAVDVVHTRRVTADVSRTDCRPRFPL